VVVAGGLGTGDLVILSLWRCLRGDVVIKILNSMDENTVVCTRNRTPVFHSYKLLYSLYKRVCTANAAPQFPTNFSITRTLSPRPAIIGGNGGQGPAEMPGAG
jgi:hypothetical protein